MPRRMARAAAAFTVTPAAPDGPPDGGAPDAQTQDQLDAIADEGTKEARARITRWNEELRTYATLDHVPVANVDEQWVREEYGGGKYKVYFLGQRGDGTYGYLKGQVKDFVIDTSVPFRGALRGRNPAAPAGAPAALPTGTSLMDMGMLQIFKTMQDNSAMMMQQMRDHSTTQAAVLERLSAPRESALEKMLPLLMPIATSLITLLGTKKDPMEIARELAVLMKPSGDGGGVREAMGTMREMLEMRELLAPSGDGDGEPGWWRLLEKVVPGAIDVIRMEAEKRGQTVQQLAQTPAVPRALAPAPVPGAPAVPGAALAAAPAAAPEPAPVADEWTPLEPHVRTLISFAQRNADPFGMMQTIKTLAPPALLAALRELVVREDATEFLMQRFPAMQPYRVWTEQLLDEFHVDFFGEDEDADPTDPSLDPSTADPSHEEHN